MVQRFGENMSSKIVKYLADYQKPTYKITQADLHFDLEPDATIVTATLNIKRCVIAPVPLILDGENLTLMSLTLDDKILNVNDYQLTEDSIQIMYVPAEFTLVIKNKINPISNTALNGLYLSSGNFCTQCEPHGFRRITYFIDRPDNLTVFTSTLVADKDKFPVLLSNGNLIKQGELSNNKHFATWHDPFPKPSYLFALVAGRLDQIQDTFTTRSGRLVDLRIYVDLGEAERAYYAMECLKKSMRWDEEQYGREYDLDIFMIVAVRDFNMGAMENKGLNIFNSAYILTDSAMATDTDYENVLRVVAHEYFHNWSGNRVTCRDWFQLSLKEGLTVFRDQTFTEDMLSPAIKRVDDVDLLRAYQFTEDGGPMAHPVLPKSYIEMNNFYTITIYEKGAELIRMLRTLLGEKTYRAATDEYFNRFDGQAVTILDFVNVMQEVSGKDLTQFKLWYDQAGTPELTFSSNYEAATQIYTLTVTQKTPSTPDQKDKLALHIPIAIGLLDQNGQEILATTILELTQCKQDFTFNGIKNKPIPSIMRGFSAPVKYTYAYSDVELLLLLQHDKDVFARYEAAQQLALRQIDNLILIYQNKKEVNIDKNYLAALWKITTTVFDDVALQALLLSLPSEKYLFERAKTIDVDAIHFALKTLKQGIASELQSELNALYHAYAEQDNSDARRLKNVCLSYLSLIDEGELAWQQFEYSLNVHPNMTDIMAALQGLNYHDNSHRKSALAQFYQRWQQNPLVVDKWFAVQAQADLPNVLEHIKTLTQSSAFNIKNPNTVRSLWGQFAANLAHFHAADGSGYEWLAESILILDKINPQIASRMVAAFAVWRKLCDERQVLAKQALDHVAAQDLSKDLFEVVSKLIQ